MTRYQEVGALRVPKKVSQGKLMPRKTIWRSFRSFSEPCWLVLAAERQRRQPKVSLSPCRELAAQRHHICGNILEAIKRQQNSLLHSCVTNSTRRRAHFEWAGTQSFPSIGKFSAQKSSQKSTRPRGAKDVDTFPGAIGRNDACRQAVERECVGFSFDGECIEAVEGVRAYQPLRGRPSQASRPNHVAFVVLISSHSLWEFVRLVTA